MLADSEDVKKTLDRYATEETGTRCEPGHTDAEKKESQERVQAASKSRADIDGASAQADALMKDVDRAIDASIKDYDDALRALRERISRGG